MIKAMRHQKILEYIEQSGNSTISQLAEMLECSNMTIRRDVHELADEGLVKKIHGGVLAIEKTDSDPNVLQQRLQVDVDEKRRIGEKATQYIKEDMCVFFDSGTTPFFVAQALPSDIRFTAITCSLLTAAELCNRPNVSIVMLGGELHNATMSSINRLSLEMAKEFTADLAIISTKAINLDTGLLETLLPLIEVKRIMVEKAKRTLVVMDAKKFEKTALCISIPISDVNQIITTNSLKKEYVEKVQKLGISLDLV